MKVKIAAFVMAATVIALVIANTFFLLYYIDETISALTDAPTEISRISEYEQIRDEYLRHEKFLALTLSHGQMKDISLGFAEMLGAMRAEDDASFIIAKSRLIETLSSLRRLSGISFESIF